MKIEFEIEFKIDTDSKNKGEFVAKFKRKAINFAEKALDVAATVVFAAEDAINKVIDKASDTLIEADYKCNKVNDDIEDNEPEDDEVLSDEYEDSEDEDDEFEEDLNDEENPSKEKLKKYTLWEYLDETCYYKLDSSQKTFDCKKEVDKFFKSIDFEANECTRKAFEISVTLKKITYDTVIENIQSYFPDLKPDDIKERFIDDFIDWIVYNRSDIDDNCRSINFILLLKYFVKKVRAS